ncbi:hypothetical protein [Halorhodospira halochloris]|nr:hypothetical protein [Halorhodospira halochloris]
MHSRGGLHLRRLLGSSAKPIGRPTADWCRFSASLALCSLLGIVMFAAPAKGTAAAATGENNAENRLLTEDDFEIGGALRFNYAAQRSDGDQRDRGGDASLDLFRLNIEGEQQGIEFSAEYRWYTNQDVLHHGWAGFGAGEHGQVRVGVSQVPFGILPYAAHNYWFGIPFYVGLGDAYKLGAQYIRENGPWDLRLAFYKNPVENDPGNLERYGFDLVNHAGCADNDDNAASDNGSGDNDNGSGESQDCTRESNQANLRLAYTLDEGGSCPVELGLSGQWGMVPNSETGEDGSRWAGAAHLDMRCGRWGVQLQAGRQVIDVDLDSTDGDGEEDTVTFGGMDGKYQVASKANLGVLNIAYNFPVPWENIDSLTCYNDFSIYHKDESDYSNSKINTTGCAIGRGPLFIYADVIRGKNAPFLGDSGAETLGEGGAGWDTYYNLNLGYYF